MTVSTVSAALLCLATWMSVAHATNGRVEDCCLGWSNTKINITLIVNYTIKTENICKVKAVIFRTKGGRRICSDPDNRWTKKAMREVDKGNDQKASQDVKEDRSTSSITPAASIAVTKKPQATSIREVDEENDQKALQDDGHGDDKSTSSITPASTTATEEPQATTIRKVDETEDRSTSSITPASTTATEEPQATTICDVNEGNDKEALQDKGHGEDKSTTSTAPATSTTTTTTIRKVDEENGQKEFQIMGRTEDRSTRDMTPAASTISKKAPKRKCRNGRRRQGRRKGKKKMRRRI